MRAEAKVLVPREGRALQFDIDYKNIVYNWVQFRFPKLRMGEINSWIR